jgi:hypothetical protein
MGRERARVGEPHISCCASTPFARASVRRGRGGGSPLRVGQRFRHETGGGGSGNAAVGNVAALNLGVDAAEHLRALGSTERQGHALMPEPAMSPRRQLVDRAGTIAFAMGLRLIGAASLSARLRIMDGGRS